MEWLLKVIWVLPIATAVIGILGIIHGIRKGGSWLVIVRDIVVTVGLTALFCMVPGILKDHYKQISSAMMVTTPANIPDITYGQAIESTCSDLSWKSFIEEKTKSLIVEVNGTYSYNGETKDIVIQFQYPDLYTSDRPITNEQPMLIAFLGFGEQTKTDEETMNNILYSMFQNYAGKNGKTVDESQKENINVNQAYLDKYKKESGAAATATPAATEEAQATEEPETTQQQTNDQDEQDTSEEEYINMVKESSPADYPDRTYGEAFENFFDDPVWQYLDDDGEKYIWFLGQCQVNGQDSNCEVHFQLDLENGRFHVVYYEVDGKEKPLENWPSVLATIFETE